MTQPQPLSLSLDVPPGVSWLVSILQDAGYEAYVVGGCVRDRLLGREPDDWDVTTSATPVQVTAAVAALNNRRWTVVPTGEKYGTVTAILRSCYASDDPLEMQVTTYRTDGNYSDGRRPDFVRFGTSLKEDLERRDFTVNALAYDPVRRLLIDHVGGLNDLRWGVLRTVGDPWDRFKEDGLRVLRAVRLSAKLSFELDGLIEVELDDGPYYLEHLSMERVRDELLKLLTCDADRVVEELERLRRSGILQLWIPEVDAMVGQQQNRHHAYQVWEHTLEVVRLTPPAPLLRLAALLHDVGKPATAEAKDDACRRCGKRSVDHIYDTTDHAMEAEYSFIDHEVVGAEMSEKICQRLKLSNADVEYVRTLVRQHLFYYDRSWSDAAVRRFLKRVPLEWLDDLFWLCRADRLGHGIHEEDKHGVEMMVELRERCEEQLRYKPPLRSSDLAINGTHVMEALGIGPGPRVGQVLRMLQEKVLDDPSLNTEEHLKRLILEAAADVPVADALLSAG